MSTVDDPAKPRESPSTFCTGNPRFEKVVLILTKPLYIKDSHVEPAMSRREFHFSDGSSNKFWAIEVSGTSQTVTFGKIGTTGQTQTKEFDSEAETVKATDKLIAEKVKKGYKEVASETKNSGAPAAKVETAEDKRPATKPKPKNAEAVQSGTSKPQETGERVPVVRDPALVRLAKELPPPEGLKGREVKWDEVEKEVGFTFPTTFKEYISLYGESEWFDLYSSALYPHSHNKKGEYMKSVRSKLKDVEEVGDEEVNDILYPEPGGLYPFMVSSDGDYYFWKMDSKDPDQWPLMVWQMPGLFKLEFKTIGEMLLNTLEEFKVEDPDRVWVYANGVTVRGPTEEDTAEDEPEEETPKESTVAIQPHRKASQENRARFDFSPVRIQVAGKRCTEYEGFPEPEETGIRIWVLVTTTAEKLTGIWTDSDQGEIYSFTDDTNQDLLAKGGGDVATGVSTDNKAAMFEVLGNLAPSPAATRVSVRGRILLSTASGTIARKSEVVALKKGKKIKVGDTEFTINKAIETEYNGGGLELELARSTQEEKLRNICSIRFEDGANGEIEFRETSSSRMGDKVVNKYFIKGARKEFVVVVEEWAERIEQSVEYEISTTIGCQ
jgi:predicted DNA-binding WGR domain protein